MATNSPEKTFRIGLTQASVWKNVIEPKEEGKGQKKTVRSVSIQRRYYDEKEDKWESSTSFQLADLPALEEVVRLAKEFVISMEADVTA